MNLVASKRSNRVKFFIMQEHIHVVLETRKIVAASRETLVFDMVPPFLVTTDN